MITEEYFIWGIQLPLLLGGPEKKHTPKAKTIHGAVRVVCMKKHSTRSLSRIGTEQRPLFIYFFIYLFFPLPMKFPPCLLPRLIMEAGYRTISIVERP